MHAPAAESGRLAGRVQPGQRVAGAGEDPGGQVGLQAAEGLAGQDGQPYGDQRAGLGVQDPVRGGRADQPVAEVPAGAVDGRHLEVLGERVGDLPVAGDDLPADGLLVEQVLLRDGVHAAHQGGQVALDDEVDAVVHEGPDRSRHRLAGAVDDAADRLPGEVGVLLGAGQAELLADDALVEDEPGVVVAGPHDVFERAEGVEAGEERYGQPSAGGVQPERGGAGQDADAVPGPDRVPVLDALGVVPHAVLVDVAGARVLGDAEHQAVHVRRDPGEHPLRLGPQGERPDGLPAARGAAYGAGRLQDLARHGVQGARGPGQPGDPVAELQLHQAAGRSGADPALERLDQAGAGAPGDVEAGYGVAVAEGVVAAPFGPADHREEADPPGVQPGPFLAGREVDVRLGPAARPGVLLAVEAGGAEPVLEGEGVAVLDPHPALLGRVDEEQSAEGPVRLAAEGLLGLLVEQDHPAARVDELRGGHQAREPRPDHDHVCVVRHAQQPSGRRWGRSLATER